MPMLAFAGRNRRELLRDPLTLAFGLGFPLVLLYLLSAIQRNVPVPLFAIDRLAPGVAAFGLTFIALFSAMLVSKDRSQSFMMRLCASPMRPAGFILGYLIPLIFMATAQIVICYVAAVPLGLSLDADALLSMATLVPAGAMYIAIGLLCGTMLTDKQVGGVCGAVLTNVCAWLSGVWFDLSLLGDGFAAFAELLPFANSVEAARAAMAGDAAGAVRPLLIVCAYAALLLAAAIGCFHKRLRAGRL